MFEEEMQEKLFRTEEENKLMNQHHEATRQLEYKHMKVCPRKIDCTDSDSGHSRYATEPSTHSTQHGNRSTKRTHEMP